MHIEVAVFEGGYGIGWHRRVAREYEQQHPGVAIDLWGDPRVDEKLKPRILRGDPPDLASCSLPIWKMIVAGKLYPLDAELSSPAYGQPGTWRSTLAPGMLGDYTYQGHCYAVPSNLGLWACWYDARMFAAHGWSPPRTWDEFTALCSSIQAAGIHPLAFQGKYPIYAWATLLSIYQRLVPFERWYAMEDLAPRAYLDPQFIRAAGMLQAVATRYFEPGALAMTHTEAQMEWSTGRAAMVFCGLWLHHEMANAIPPGFRMACFPVPTVTGGAGDQHAVYSGGAEDFFVFAGAQHPVVAADFLKYMLSIGPAQRYTQELDTLSPVSAAVHGVDLSPDLAGAEAILRTSTRKYSDRVTSLYPAFANGPLHDALADLLAGKCTPRAFAERLQAAIDEIKRDPDVYKPPKQGVPPG